MKENCAGIVIDTGFSLESLRLAGRIVGVIDLPSGQVSVGNRYIRDNNVLANFAGDPFNHGSLVLKALMERAPDMPVVLVRAYGDDLKLMRTVFRNGEIVGPGWTEAYLNAVEICKQRGLRTVANLSFGGYTHAVDGTGWESHRLAQVTGIGKPGHIVVAGAGAGDGAAIHASWLSKPTQTTSVYAYQEERGVYNLWCSTDAALAEASDWLLEVFLNNRPVLKEIGRNLRPNLWNNRKQVMFTVEGHGAVKISVSRTWGGSTSSGGRRGRGGSFVRGRESTGPAELTFDCWIVQQHGEAAFCDHLDRKAIAEPAVFPHVIAVGLTKGKYSTDQNEPLAKPDHLIGGDGPISFRLPEVVARVQQLLADDPTLDVGAVRQKLGKFRQ